MAVNTKLPADIEGFEYDWLGSDADGHVALFSTAGAGYAPPEFLADTDAHDAAIALILGERAKVVALRAPEVSVGLVNIWREVAERGLFAFDCDPNGGPYKLVAVPSHPANIADLPPSAAAIVARIVFRHLRFSESELLSKALLQSNSHNSALNT